MPMTVSFHTSYTLQKNRSRVGFVFDAYYEDSLKCETRRKVTGKVTGNTRSTHAWNTFLHGNETRLNPSFGADKIVSNNTDSNIVVTKEENVSKYRLNSTLQPWRS